MSNGPAQAQEYIYSQFALARYNGSDGSLDRTFDGDGKVLTDLFSSRNEGVKDVAVQHEIRLLKLMVEGASYRAAAVALGVTVKTDVPNACRRQDLHVAAER